MKRKTSKSKKKSVIPYFVSASQMNKTGKKSMLFGSKRVLFIGASLIVLSFLVAGTIIQKTRDSSAAATLLRNNSTYTCDWGSANGMLVEGCSPGFSYLSQNGPGGDRVVRSALTDGMSNAPSGVPNERVDAQGGNVPLGSTQWITGWQRIVDVPSNIPEGSGFRWHLMGFWEIHGRSSDQAIIMPEIWKQNGQVRYRMNANAGYDAAKYYDIGPVTLNQWEYWEVGVNYQNNSSGWIRVYKNNQLVATFNGVVTRESGGGYWKIANYRNATLNGKSTIDFSGVRVWNGRPPLPSQFGSSGQTSNSTNPPSTPTTPPPTTPPPTTPPPTTPPPTTPPPTTPPPTTPPPTSTPSTQGQLGANDWSKWEYKEAAGPNKVNTWMTHNQSGRLLMQFDANKSGYANTQYGYHCIYRSSSAPQPKSITFTATYNAKGGNFVYFYTGDSSNKIWKVQDTSGNTVTKTMTLSLGSKTNYCFGNVTIDYLNGERFGANRFLNVTDYRFNY